MTKEEYNLKQKMAYESYEKVRLQIVKEYALSNNTVEVGDILIDHSKKILVNKIQVYYSGSNSFPMCIYHGIELKVDNTPKKNNIKSSIYQSNIEHHFKKVTI